MTYIKEVIKDTHRLYKYYTLKGKFVLTAIAIMSIFNTLVGDIYDMIELRTYTWEGNLRRRANEYRNSNKG